MSKNSQKRKIVNQSARPVNPLTASKAPTGVSPAPANPGRNAVGKVSSAVLDFNKLQYVKSDLIRSLIVGLVILILMMVFYFILH